MKNKVITLGVISIFLLTNFLIPIGSCMKTNTTIQNDPGIKQIAHNIDMDDIPKIFDWRDINGTDFTTPIRDLKPIPACEAFALCAAVETMIQYKVGNSFNCDLSEAHLFFCSGGDCSWGVHVEDAADYLVENGVPDEACWPYPRVKNNYPCNTTSPDWEDRAVKITNWHWLPENKYEIKKALINYGPVVAYIDFFKDFSYYIGGIYEHRWGKSAGSHWVTIIGYNDQQGYWICENSYGTRWGENGYFRIKYGELGIEKHALYIEDVYGHFPILYVDDDNTQGPWNGTIEHPYQTIKDGIDHAYEGWTVFVRNGTYNENLVIDKTIKLMGEDRNGAIIYGNGVGDVVFIKGGEVEISGFTIMNSGNDLYDAGIEVRLYGTDGSAIIKDNVVKNNVLGVFVHFPSSNVIKDNLIENNSDGIYVWESYDNVIKNNVIRNNIKNGIELVYSRSIITGNNIFNNGAAGIFLDWRSNGNLISNKNTIENNSIGILINRSTGNIIAKNNLVNNGQQAYFIRSYANFWIRNYWSDWPRLLPKRINGLIGKIEMPWANVDYLPSRVPHV